MNRFAALLARYFLRTLALVLLAASLFFTTSVEITRRNTMAKDPDAFHEGDTVTIVKVVDADEVVVRAGERQTLVRLLGIKSFSATITDPGVSQYGKICFDYLKSRALDQSALIQLGDTKSDSRDRLLAYLMLKDDSGAYTVDLGKELVEKGYTLVYTRYDFTRQEDYLATQFDAREDARGFWANGAIRTKAELLDIVWREEKQND